MLELPDRLKQIAEEVHQGKQSKESPRTLMSWFGFKRRTSGNAWYMDEALKKAGLKTHPDFKDVWVDELIAFVPLDFKEPSGSAEEPIAETDTVYAEDTIAIGGAPLDPMYRVRRLPAANKHLISVNPNAPLREAISLMLVHGLPGR